MEYNSNREISNENNSVTYSSLLFKGRGLHDQIGGEICEFILGNGHSLYNNGHIYYHIWDVDN